MYKSEMTSAKKDVAKSKGPKRFKKWAKKGRQEFGNEIG